MYLKILKKVCCSTNFGLCSKNTQPDIIKTISQRRMAYMWGHDTLEDKAARKRQVEESRVRITL